MKNASDYEKKIKKLLRGMEKAAPPEPPRDEDAVAFLVESVLQADASLAAASQAMEQIRNEFVDFNELRVALPKDIIECIGRDYPRSRAKAVQMTTVLGNIFARTYNVSIDYMDEMTKRDLRRHLLEIGLNEYSSARIVLVVFGGHAVPVDETLMDTLRMDDMVHEDTDIADTQGFLERVIAQKDAYAAHLALREYVDNRADALAEKRAAETAARRKAEEQARAAADAAEEETKARERRAAKAKKAKKSKKAAKKARKKSDKKSPAKKSTKGSAKAAKKTAKKKTSGTSKKSARKTSSKSGAKKTPRSDRKKSGKKATKKAAKRKKSKKSGKK
jgi:hypothetical protein